MGIPIFRFSTDQVEIFRRGDEVILREYPSSALAIFDIFGQLPKDFRSQEREESPPQEREFF